MNKVDLIRKKLKKLDNGKVLLRKNNTCLEKEQKGIITYDVLYDDVANPEAIKKILEDEGLCFSSDRIYGNTYIYSFQFEIPIEYTGIKPNKPIPIDEISNEILILNYGSLSIMADKYKYKNTPQYQNMLDEINKIEEEILSRMVVPIKNKK